MSSSEHLATAILLRSAYGLMLTTAMPALSYTSLTTETWFYEQSLHSKDRAHIDPLNNIPYMSTKTIRKAFANLYNIEHNSSISKSGSYGHPGFNPLSVEFQWTPRAQPFCSLFPIAGT